MVRWERKKEIYLKVISKLLSYLSSCCSIIFNPESVGVSCSLLSTMVFYLSFLTGIILFSIVQHSWCHLYCLDFQNFCQNIVFVFVVIQFYPPTTSTVSRVLSCRLTSVSGRWDIPQSPQTHYLS